MYQCCVEYSNLELPKQNLSWGDFYWECLLDAKPAFKQYSGIEIENNPNGGREFTLIIVHSIFARVHIIDLHLAMKSEDGNFEDEIISSSNDSISHLDASLSSLALARTERSNSPDQEGWLTANDQSPQSEIQEKEIVARDFETQEHDLVSLEEEKHYYQSKEITLNPSDKFELKQILKEKHKTRKRHKRCQKFVDKLKALQFSPGFFLEEKEDVNNGNNKYSTTSFKLSDVTDYYEYETSLRKHINELTEEKKFHRKTSLSVGKPTMPDDLASSSIEIVEETEKSNSALPMDSQHLSIEEMIQFDFGYSTERDQQLLAKNAKDFFANDKTMKKYWYQRYRFFSKLDDGILMDRESWFSVTPERLAQHVAERLVRIQNSVIFDAFTGAGGNSIQFALRGGLVYTTDIDPIKIRCASRNAKIYGVSERINFICGDYFNIIKAMQGAKEAKEERRRITSASAPSSIFCHDDPYPCGIDAFYLSPPWGGPSYYQKSQETEFDLRKDMVIDGFKVFKLAKLITPNIVLFLPKNTSISQLIELAAPDGQVEIEQSMLSGKIKALHAYYGRLVTNE